MVKRNVESNMHSFFENNLLSLNNMPQCKNDPKRFYTGSEPSPKGRGFCAHAEKLKTKKKGTDERMWVVKKTTIGVKRWVPVPRK